LRESIHLPIVIFVCCSAAVQAQLGTGPFCITDGMCDNLPGGPRSGICLGCPKRSEDGGSTGDCEFTIPEDSGNPNPGSSKDGKGNGGKDKKKKKSKRRRLKKSGDDDDDGGNGGNTDPGGINGDPVFNANCCDCSCVRPDSRESCTCICYGFVDPTDGGSVGGGGSSKDGKGKGGKDKKKSRRRRRHLQSDDEDLTVHDEESHVRSRLAKRNEMDADASDGNWHSWLLNSLWGSEDEEAGVIDNDRKLKTKKKSEKKKSEKKKSKKKTVSSDDGDDDDDSGGNGNGATNRPTNRATNPPDDGSRACEPPPTQCFYIKRFVGQSSTELNDPSKVCQVNTYGRCALNTDLNRRPN
jgi:hypothetical protein